MLPPLCFIVNSNIVLILRGSRVMTGTGAMHRVLQEGVYEVIAYYLKIHGNQPDQIVLSTRHQD